MKNFLEIAQEAELKPIKEIASQYDIKDEEMVLYGESKAKLDLSILDRLKDKEDGKLILTTGVTPTPFGEGKTCTTVGLTQAFGQLGKKVMAALRQPSAGPVFGIKGGAAGGGYSQVLPMEDINLGLTGDIHAVGMAHNLLAAMLDASITKGNKLNIDPNRVYLNRVIDMNDRALRNIVLAAQPKEDIDHSQDVPEFEVKNVPTAGVTRASGFDITAASEVMAILALASDLQDFKRRCGNMIVASTYDGEFVRAKDIKAEGAMAILMKEAIKPNLVQTMEGQGCLIHAGPFANIAHGTNSVIADKIALKLADYVVTESGFGSDLGGEKFFDIACRHGDLRPDAVIIVVSVRAMKMHGGAFEAKPGRISKEEMKKLADEKNVEAVKKGAENMVAHIENMKNFGVPVIVALNKFPQDDPEELDILKEIALENGATDAVVSDVVAQGGKGGIELAKSVMTAIEEEENNFQFLYDDDLSIKDKIETIAKKSYGADGVEYSETAEEKIKFFEEQGLGTFPICMAKTHLSISDDASLMGRPTGFKVTIKDIRPSGGAEFLYPILGKMLTLPGLPATPAAVGMDIDKDGTITGLF